MIETIYNYKSSESKLIERIVDDENINLNHIVLAKGECLPEHYSNSNVYLLIVKGIMSIKLAEQEMQKYAFPKIVNVPFNVKMNICNSDEDILEFFVVKSPNPKNYEK